jgi:hypothetical protein
MSKVNDRSLTAKAKRPPDGELEPRYWKLGHWFYSLVFALSPKRRMHGITVASSPVGTHEVDASLDKVDRALKVIAESTPARYAHIRRDVQRIWVGPIPNYARGQWIEELRLCMLRDSFVGDEEVSDAYVAALIVHEGAHARVARAGISFDEEMRPRVERLCIKSQLAFVRRHPDGGPLVELFEENLKRADSWWSDQRLRSVQLRALKELGLHRKARWAIDRATQDRD